MATVQPIRPQATRDADAFYRAQRHSRVVRILKLALPVLAAAGLGVFAWFTVFANTAIPDIAVDISNSAIKDGKVVMANPRLDGFTRDNKPYSMTAERAVQDAAGGQTIALENVDASVPFRNEATAKIEAEAATYDSQAQTLTFDRPMTVTTSDGMRAIMQSGHVDIEGGALQTADPVEISLGGSHITADSMTVSENGKVLVFEKRVRLNIDPAAVKAAKADRIPENEGKQP